MLRARGTGADSGSALLLTVQLWSRSALVSCSASSSSHFAMPVRLRHRFLLIRNRSHNQHKGNRSGITNGSLCRCRSDRKVVMSSFRGRAVRTSVLDSIGSGALSFLRRRCRTALATLNAIWRLNIRRTRMTLEVLNFRESGTCLPIRQKQIPRCGKTCARRVRR